MRTNIYRIFVWVSQKTCKRSYASSMFEWCTKKGTHSKYETRLAFGPLPLSESLSRNMHMAPQPILNWHWGDAAGKLLVQKKPKKCSCNSWAAAQSAATEREVRVVILYFFFDGWNKHSPRVYTSLLFFARCPSVAIIITHIHVTTKRYLLRCKHGRLEKVLFSALLSIHTFAIPSSHLVSNHYQLAMSRLLRCV